MDTSSPAAPEKPWLRNRQWAHRELVDQRGLGWPVFVLVYVLGLAFLAVIWGTVRQGDWESVAIALFVVAVLAILARLRLRGMRYGRTVCRLITLPGVIDGWFKADVECGLPPEAGTVTVRLKNVVPSRYGEGMLWSMEQLFPVAPIAQKPARSIVNIRLRVPRHRSQKPLSPSTGFAFGAPLAGQAWILELEKKGPGVDFFSQFNVPIYDTPDAPAQEQQPE